MHSRARRLAVNAILITLLIVFTFLMKLPFALVATAVLPLIVLIVGSQIEGWWTSLLLSIVFGALSCVGAFINPTPLAPIFQNPLVSVLPRVFIGWIGLACYKAGLYIVRRLSKNGEAGRWAQLAVSSIGGGMTTIANTALVLPAIWLLYGGDSVGGTAITIEFVTGLISVNFAVELIGAILLPPLIVRAVSRFLARERIVVLTDADIDRCSADNVSDADDFDRIYDEMRVERDTGCKADDITCRAAADGDIAGRDIGKSAGSSSMPNSKA